SWPNGTSWRRSKTAFAGGQTTGAGPGRAGCRGRAGGNPSKLGQQSAGRAKGRDGMSDASKSLRAWLTARVQGRLQPRAAPPPLLVWCDPQHEWLELLRAAAGGGLFELWADPAEKEIAIRHRFYRTPRAARVVWLPCSREDISWFRVYEMEADEVWQQ